MTAPAPAPVTELRARAVRRPRRKAPALVPAPRLAADASVMAQIRAAARDRASFTVGALLGGFVPGAVWWLSHRELDPSRPPWLQLGSLLVLGGLLFSAGTVFSWGRRAFRSTWKALGFVVLVEGVMVLAVTEWLGLFALAYLVAINAVATGCNLSLDRR